MNYNTQFIQKQIKELENKIKQSKTMLEDPELKELALQEVETLEKEK